jgi:hypothetical protein
MSRSGYSDDIDQWDLIRWRGAVKAATRGKRGQRLLRDLAEALDAMPVKALIAHELENEHGEVCALGAVGKARGIDMSRLDAEEPSEVAHAFDIAQALAQEVAYMNDEAWHGLTPEKRWLRVRSWVAENLVCAPPDQREKK